MLYKFEDETIPHIEAANAEEFVRKMHEAAFVKESDDRAYMEAVAERVATVRGALIDTTNAEAFLKDLIYFGVVKGVALNPFEAGSK